jgi:sirohydrochlorin ferrochelatase
LSEARGSLVLVTHGVEGRPGVVAAHAKALSCGGFATDVRIACLKGEPGLDEALAGARHPLVVVPLLMADGFIMRLLRDRLAGEIDVTLRQPVGVDPRLAALIAGKAVATCAKRGWRLEASSLLLVGHGTPRHAGSTAAVERHAAVLAAEGTFADVRTAYLDQSPFLVETAASLDRPCVAVGLFVDDGPHGRDDVLEALAGAKVTVVYTGAIGGDPAIVELIAETACIKRAGCGSAPPTSARPASGSAPRPARAREA